MRASPRTHELFRGARWPSLSAPPCVCPAWARCNGVKVPCFMNSNKERKPDQGNCGVVRLRGKEAYVKDVSPRTGTWYKADGMGELAQHSEALSSLPEVNHGVVHRNNAFLPGEASLPCGAARHCGASGDGRATGRGVSRGRSSRIERAGSSRRRVTRPAKVTGGLRRGEGPNRTCGTNRKGLRIIVRLFPWRTVFRGPIRLGGSSR